MDTIKVGNYIKNKRNEKNLTQKELADLLNVTPQAVSKWEKGETLPDTAILLELANHLETSVDLILNGGVFLNDKRKLISVKDIIDGFISIENIKRCFGSESLFYKAIIEGINKKMNMDIEDALINYREVLYTEVILQAVDFENKTFNLDEVKHYFKNEKMISILEKKLKQIS